MNQIALGIELMIFGLAGVFIVLIMFYIMIRLLVILFPEKDPERP